MRKFLATSIFLFLFFFAANAQTIESTLAKYSNYQPEKAYLQYDKSSYAAGETVWFKAYIIEGVLPAEGSKTFYIDWIADNGTVLTHSVSPVVNGATNGQFKIPSDYAGNFIHVRAYTKWMLNFDTAFLYSKDIRILKKNTAALKSARPQIISSLQFFPEGGDAVAGVPNKIAFKANDQWGRPVSVKGVILNNGGALIDSFHSVHDGMGYVLFTPQPGMNYSAKWKDEKGAGHTTALPSVQQSGIAMEVTIEGDKRFINMNGSNLTDNLKQLHLVGTMNQQMAFKTDVVLVNNTARKIIPTKNLPTGILTITLFDANWNAIAERITFINNHDYSFQPQMEVTHWGLSKRKRNELRISIPDSLQNASLSIAVTDASIEKDTSDNIISHFLLTSDIKGRVNDPAYYFSNNNDPTGEYLDLVMLTNGWRRFKWEDVVKGKLPTITYPKDTTYLTLSGKVFGVAKSQLSGKESIVLLLKEKDSATKMMILPIASNATFNDPEIIFFDTVHIYYSLKSKFLRLAEARFMTERLPTPNYSSFSKNFITYNPFYDTAGSYHHSFFAAENLRLQNIQKGKMMETVTITAKTKSPVQVLDEKYTSGLFKSGDSYQFDLVNDPLATAYLNIFQYLQGKVAGLQINTNPADPSLSWRGGAPELFLDEIHTDASMISTIPVTDIAYIKVFRPPFMGGFNGSNGAIAIYTRKGNDTQDGPARGGLSKNTVEGYTPIKQFYSPDYDSFDPRNEQPDVRTTLYWNPLLFTTSKKPSVTVTFYNNDITQSFRVVIEGMTQDGLLTHYEQVME